MNSQDNPIALAAAKFALMGGVPLIPIPLKEKGCQLFNWQKAATSDPTQIALWVNSRHDYNAGAVAKSTTKDGICILDIDDLTLLNEILVIIGKTFVVKSSKGFHFYFRHTALSRKLGNRSLAGQFDFQAHNKYVVSPFSIHPSGAVYTISEDNPIMPIPDALVAWIANKQPQTQSTPQENAQKAGILIGGSLVTKDSFENWLTKHNEDYEDGEYIKSEARWRWIRTDRCPWESLHTNKNGDKDFAIFLHDLTGPQIRCMHTSCGKHWADFRQFVVDRDGADYSMVTGKKFAESEFPRLMKYIEVEIQAQA